VDNLPNAADYRAAQRCVTTMLDAGGNPVDLFSDANQATVETQFSWMQQYGLDGVALQRFAVDLFDPATLQARNIVLANVRKAAEDNGRVSFVVEQGDGIGRSQGSASKAEPPGRKQRMPAMVQVGRTRCSR
jgi:hypothetical protein